MGGYQSVDLASRLIVDSLTLPAEFDFSQHLKRLCSYLHWFNRRPSQELTLTPQRKDTTVGSMVADLLLEQNRLAFVWTG